jgi:SAM-dependent methyltransferase
LAGKHGLVLDMGCGGGWAVYAKVGPVVGVDLSLPSLVSARSIYQHAVVADLGSLPFAGCSFDFVVSSDVLGHVPFADKGAVVAEIHRVLKPGGLTAHYVEADGNDPLMRFAKRYPDLYQKYVVEPEGHIGLEPAEAVARRFRNVGFKPIAEIPAYRGLSYLSRYVQYFDNEYLEYSRRIRAIVTICKLLQRVKFVDAAVNILLSGLIEVGDRVLPASWAGGVLVLYQK